ncbi:hypothetical protein [Mesorhizobium abyssinicae]|uniref:hypothetical protein n=2 Tax=Mesorhizobium abyssinicae TaxID=1209958 RepID=UPI000FCCC66B|nr:hypothetical protein EOA31_30715 [Mesorhizobium sp. M4B.F.Ca.ET.049.02.1.2]RVD20857.1 hypothetical protein EN738_20885 [Mesorhizobium sp. M4B.F.Ca.ET.017.02.2.1]
MMSHKLMFGPLAVLSVTALGLALIRLASAFREFVHPRYRPELHYMRGPGPATARRASAR